jgi:outer membrane immunogenic protein
MTMTLVRCFAGSMAGAAALVGGTALAADLPTKKGPPLAPIPLVAPISWTGFYASLEGGYAWDGTIVYIGPWNKGFGDTGVFGGANVGYNYQIGSFVIGAQAGYDFANARGSAYAIRIT